MLAWAAFLTETLDKPLETDGFSVVFGCVSAVLVEDVMEGFVVPEFPLWVEFFILNPLLLTVLSISSASVCVTSLVGVFLDLFGGF